MSSKDPGTKSSPQPNKPSFKDHHDVELTFLKKVNETYSTLSSPCCSEQSGKCGRTSSDNGNDPYYMGNGIRKGSSSS